MSYKTRLALHIKTPQYKRAAWVLLGLAILNIGYNAVWLLLRWEKVRETWLSPEYRFLYHSPFIEIAKAIFHPGWMFVFLYLIVRFALPLLPIRAFRNETERPT